MNWIETEIHYEYHEAASLFPLIEGEDFEQLKVDIAARGLIEPIWLHEDKIIDGRNRYRACIETGTEPRFRTWGGEGSLVLFVISMNLHRRHLTTSQRAAIAVEMLPMLEAEAARRQRELAGTRPRLNADLAEIFPQGRDCEARKQAAEKLQTNSHYVSDAKKLKDDAPDLFEQVKVGEKTIPQAKREMVKRERAETPPIPSDKYRMLYADPPWKYGNKGLDDYGHAERHYPTMSISELCALPIKDLAEDSAVLFLWVTSPLLEECFPVIKAWGFSYKTSFVWDKVKHNFGHYNSVRHELLLVCTRGSCTPDVNKLFDSVQSIERSNEHSEKPEEFRAIIDTLYTHGKRIELFARRQVDGWDTWGNEPTTR